MNVKTAAHIVNPIAAGMLMGAGIFFPAVWPSIFIGTALLIHAVATARTYATAYFASAVCFLTFFTLSSYPFFGTVVMPEKIQPFGSILTYLAWVTTAGAATITAALFGPLAKRLLNNSWFDYLTIPSAFTICVALSSWGVDLVHAGEPLRVGGHMTLGSPAYLLTNDPVLLQTVSVLGIFGLIFIIGFFGFALFSFSTKRASLRFMAALCAIAVLAWLISFFLLQQFIQNETMRAQTPAVALSAKLPPRTADALTSSEVRYRLLSALTESVPEGALVVFPENGGVLDHLTATSKPIPTALAHAALIIDSSYVEEGGVPKNRVHYYAPKSNESVFSYKWYFVPFGEFVPLWLSKVVSLPFFKPIQDGFYDDKVYTPGVPRAVSSTVGNVAALLCVEAIPPNTYRTQTLSGAHILANLASFSSFSGRVVTSASMEGIYKARAVENRRYLIVSSDSAPAYIISPYGEVVAQKNGYTALQGFIRARSDITPYTRFGNLVLIPFVLLTCIGIYIHKRNRLRTTHN